MLESFAQMVLEQRHLYNQNAAMKHGVPDPPRRTYTERRTVVTKPAPQPPDPEPGATRAVAPEPPRPVTVEQPKQSLWPLIALAAGSLLGGAGLTSLLIPRGEPDPPAAVVKPSDPGQTLLEYLDDRGYSRPLPGASDGSQ